MKRIWLLAACAAALSGCAAPQSAVRANAVQGFGAGARTYAFMDGSDQQGERGGRPDGFAPAVERRLAELGFTAAPQPVARYRIALTHETRPASVGIEYGGCADGAPCGAPTLPPGFEWPGAKLYVHSLTLRFFDRTDGREAYKVSAAKRDRDPDTGHAIDALVASALARLPFGDTGTAAGDRAGTTDWKVTLSKPVADAAPHVTGIDALAH